MSEEKKNQYVVPASIIFAGFLIAVAIIYIGGGPAKTGNQRVQEEVLEPVDVAKKIGLNIGEFEKCMEEDRFVADVEADTQDALAAGGAGTPYTIVVNKKGQKFPIYGALPYAQVKSVIESAKAGDADALAALEIEAGGPVGELVALNDNDHMRGNKDAAIQLIEFSDLQCPFCKNFHPTMEQIVAEYGDEVVWAYRHLPLDSIHPLARPLAEASECAADIAGEDAFWKYIGYVFSQ